ncbi:ABC transporter permease subunit [Candidatus Sodalis endolongispinus]|uniref:ABC transporter permease subunit n=1 Tax=Candidatus Sodalis endolongispinus TaxID=2812662 RepID=A0ABS5YEJ6_9GAMM|nr:ABC transporter permease subunit [Candidatus Sodalis endolongispinus]MBT9433387.1 ABC transporter permease subunit [Candidatus Sodalis endolongispinus]
MNFDWSVILDNLTYLLWGRAAEGEPGGLLLTIMIALGAGVIALALGVLLAAVAWRYSGWPRRLLFIWAELIRGIPLIFVIFWLYFLLPVAFGHSLPGAVTVTLALAWFTSAAVMHATLAGLRALPTGQVEDGLASGLSHWHVLRLILLPQAWPNVLPSWSGLLTSLIKDTSLAFIVNVPELTTVSGQVNSRLQIYPAEIFLLIGALYYVLCASLTSLAAWFARSVGAGR